MDSAWYHFRIIYLEYMLEIAFFLDVQVSVLESHLLSFTFCKSFSEAFLILDVYTASYLKQIDLK